MLITYTKFGETKLVNATPYNMSETDIPHEVLWVERGEDMYALDSPEMRGKKIAIVRRDDWLLAHDWVPANNFEPVLCLVAKLPAESRARIASIFCRQCGRDKRENWVCRCRDR
ncbi:hypothetical protein [Marivivens donghaensis]|uniref:hypothetical protein n=1 Tax=Marivivens donghaensis TaxID=1699413 RepID=UPI003F697A7B